MTSEYFRVSPANKGGYRRDCRECEREYDRKLRATKSYKVRKRKYDQRRKREKREEYNAYMREYNKREEVAEKRRVYWQKRYAKKMALPNAFTLQEWEDVKGQFNHACAYCGEEKELTQDHFIPLSKGGEYTINNIIPACISCNVSKKDKDFFKWYPSYKYYARKREEKILSHLNYNTNKEQQLSLL